MSSKQAYMYAKTNQNVENQVTVNVMDTCIERCLPPCETSTKKKIFVF